MAFLSTLRVKKFFDLRITNGLCAECGIENNGDFRKCLGCRKKDNVRTSLRRKERRLKGESENTCTKCGKPRIGKIKLCRRCYFQNVAQSNLGSSSFALALESKLIEQEYRCYYSKEILVLGENASVDHLKPKSRFPNEFGSLNNVVWCLDTINSMKWDLTEDEFICLCRQIGKIR